MAHQPTKLPSKEDRHRGKQLRRWRDARDMSQGALGKAVGTRQQTIGKLEQGYLWDFDWARKLADALGIEPSVFFPHEPLSENEMEILRIARQLSTASLETWKAIGLTIKEREEQPFRKAG